jgi:outer membrane protein assembly factor BamB
MPPLKAFFLVLALAPNLVAQGDEWPQWRGPGRDGVWRESGLLTKLPDRLEAKWRVPIGSGYCGPTVADGRVYVMDRLKEPDEVERVLCFDWRTGERLWTHEYASVYRGIMYEAGPRCSVLIADGLAYSLGTMGHLFCLNAETGEVVWSRDLRVDYAARIPIWGIAASPVMEGELLIVPACGENDAYLVAFDRKSGEERWRALPDEGNYSAPMVIDQGGRRVIVSRTDNRVVGVDAETGTLRWEHPFKSKNMPLSVATPVLYEDMGACCCALMSTASRWRSSGGGRGATS